MTTIPMIIGYIASAAVAGIILGIFAGFFLEENEQLKKNTKNWPFILKK